MLVYWLIVMLRPQLAIGRAASVAMFISAAVEFSQLCHAPWLDTIRRNPLGGLIPGWGFSWGSPMRAESPFAASWISG